MPEVVGGVTHALRQQAGFIPDGFCPAGSFPFRQPSFDFRQLLNGAGLAQFFRNGRSVLLDLADHFRSSTLESRVVGSADDLNDAAPLAELHGGTPNLCDPPMRSEHGQYSAPL